MSDAPERIRTNPLGNMLIPIRNEHGIVNPWPGDLEYVRADLYDAAIAEHDAAIAENTTLASWQCLYADGETGIVCNEYGHQHCAMERRAVAAEAEAHDTGAERAAWKEIAETAIAERDAALAQVERLRGVLGQIYCNVDGWNSLQISNYIRAALAEVMK